MDFAFSEEQELLRGSARDFLADRFSPERVVELALSDEGWDPGSLKQMAELGWLGLSVPESSGGAGMGFLEEAVLFEELGKVLYPGPYFATVALALPALASETEVMQRIAAGDAAATLAWAEPSGAAFLGELDSLDTKAESTNGTWKLTGEKHLVPDLAAATEVVVAAAAPGGPGLWAVTIGDEGVEARVQATVDRTRRTGALTLNGASARLLVEPEETQDVLRVIEQRALASLALEAVGVAQTALDLALAHATERVQFEKPIGTYQAVSHPIADSFMELELARSLAYWAAWCVAEQDEQADIAVAAAKVAAAQAAVDVCERSIQIHGGIGFTWEHALHRYYKRAQWIDAFEGHSARSRASIAASLLD